MSKSIVSNLTKSHDVSVDVISLTFDAHPSNLSAMKVLGCELDNPEQLKTAFKYLYPDYQIAVFLPYAEIDTQLFRTGGGFLYK